MGNVYEKDPQMMNDDAYWLISTAKNYINDIGNTISKFDTNEDCELRHELYMARIEIGSVLNILNLLEENLDAGKRVIY